MTKYRVTLPSGTVASRNSRNGYEWAVIYTGDDGIEGVERWSARLDLAQAHAASMNALSAAGRGLVAGLTYTVTSVES